MFLSTLSVFYRRVSQSTVSATSTFTRCIQSSAVDLAARKGTREKARKKKVKVEVKKIGFIPHNQRGLDKISISKVSKHVDDSWRQISNDNVYPTKYYRWHIYSVIEAIECHRETHHPTIYNVPDAPVNVRIELNMHGEKANKYVDNFHRIAMIPHAFQHNEDRTIIVFCKGQELQNAASEAGATLVGGTELIKDIQNGDLKLVDFQYAIAHPNILPELVAIRGLMKKKFPSPKSGTLGADVGDIVSKFLNGIQYDTVKDEHQQDYGFVETCFGTLNMDPLHLEANLAALLQDINGMRPRRDGSFIKRCLIKSPPSVEAFKINPFAYVEENQNVKATESSEDLQSDKENIQAIAN